MRLTLTVTEGPSRGLTFSFEEHSTFLVGRALEAHFRLPENDPYFSRMQFFIEVNPPLCRLLDTRSRNGTLVNGVRVSTADLHDGDLIQAGHTTLRVSLEVPAVPAPGQTLDLPAVPQETASLPMALPVSGVGDAVPMALPLSEAPVTNSPVAAPTGAATGLPTIPGYELLRELGRGGMGVVYQARSLADGAQAAVKTILPAVAPTEATLARFLREAKILGQLEHAHIVRFRDMGRSGEQLYFAMDFVQGTDAAQLVRERGPLPVGRAVNLICQLLDALAYAHGKGFVHRDIKPGNLLVTSDSGRDTAKLADFGLARTYQASQLSGLTMTGTPGGTAQFMPPEQVLDFRTVKPAADQYAAAAALYHLLTARPLFDGAESSLDLMMKVLQGTPVPVRSRRPELLEPLAKAIHRGLAHKPEERYPDVRAFRQALLPFAQA